MNKLIELGIHKEDSLYGAYINLTAINNEYTKAYSEGIISKTVSTGYSMGRNTVQIGLSSIKRLWELILKLIKGIIDMFKKMVLEFGDNSKRMSKIINEIDTWNKDFDHAKLVDITDIENVQYAIETTGTMNAAGWNLSFVEEKTGNNLKVNNTVAVFASLLAMRASADNNADGVNLDGLKRGEDLFARLEQGLLTATTIYMDYSKIAELTGNGSVASSIKKDVDRNKGHNSFFYRKLSPANYGKYVAQAFSPAGAFVTTRNNESTWRRQAREANYKKLITPETVSDIPADKFEQELKNSLKYIYILLDYWLDTNPLEQLKAKTAKFDALYKSADALSKLTREDVRNARSRGDSSDNTNTSYQQSKNYDNLYNQNNQSNQNTPSSASYDINMILLKEEIQSYMGAGEQIASDDANYKLNDTANEMNSNNTTLDNYRDGISLKSSPDLTNNKIDNSINIRKGDINTQVAKYGLEYLKEYLLTTGNLAFQEGKFFNMLTKTMCDVGEHLLKVANDYLDDRESDAVSNTNNNNNANNNGNNNNANNSNNK